MRAGLWCVLFCLVCGGCVTPAGRCEGPLQPINAPPQSKAAQTSVSTDPDGSIP